jgi:Flp pilus assembly pilin Flp
MMTLVSRFIEQKAGATAVRDGLIAAGIAIALTGADSRMSATLTPMSSRG